jgi:iron complex outermembrane receptor protein
MSARTSISRASTAIGRAFGEFRISSPAGRIRCGSSVGLFWQRQSHNIEQNYIIDDIADAITVPGTDSNIWLTKQLRTDRDYAAFWRNQL